MVVISSRDFRANQRKYLNLALTNDVVITSRSLGSFRIVPVTEKDLLIESSTLDAKIKRGIEQYEKGFAHKIKNGESVKVFLRELIEKECF